MTKYLINTTLVYRVPTVTDALQLREKLSKDSRGELVQFSYVSKEIKVKGEVVEEYQLVKAKLQFQSEKDPVDTRFDAEFGNPEVTIDD